MAVPDHRSVRSRLVALDELFLSNAHRLAVFLVFDRPDRVNERPALTRTYFAERCLSDAQLEDMIEIFRAAGAWVELFAGEQPFVSALASGEINACGRELKLAYNGIGWGIGRGAFEEGRKALVPLLADSYRLLCANSSAYNCVFTLNKFHSFLSLRAMGFQVPKTWQYGFNGGDWTAGMRPKTGTRVIAKSTSEAWSVGVTEASVFTIDDTSEAKLNSISGLIGQAVTVQEFIPGQEVYVSVFSVPKSTSLKPVRVVLAKAPDDPLAIMTIDDSTDTSAVSYVAFDGPDRVEKKLRNAAVAVADTLGLSGMSRIDFRIDAEGRNWIFDIAVSPGLGRTSAAFAAIRAYGLEYDSFLRSALGSSLGKALTSTR